MSHTTTMPTKLVLGVGGSIAALTLPTYLAELRLSGVERVAAILTASARTMVAETAMRHICDACYTDDDGVVQHAQLDWPEGGGVMIGAHKPQGPFTHQPGTAAAYVVTADPEAVLERARATGVEVPDAPTEQDYGSREVALRDPEGNQWSFGTYAGEPRRR